MRGRKARGHDVVAPDHGDVDGQVVSAKLDHPRRRFGWCAKECEVVLGRAETDATAASRATPWSAGGAAPWSAGSTSRTTAGSATAATPVLQHFITVHDLGDLAVAIAAQRGRHDLEGGLALGRGQVAEPQSGPFEDSGWQVRPPHFLRGVVEAEQNLRAVGFGQRREECLGRCRHRRRDACRRHRLRRRARTCRHRGSDQGEEDERGTENRPEHGATLSPARQPPTPGGDRHSRDKIVAHRATLATGAVLARAEEELTRLPARQNTQRTMHAR